MYKHLSNRPINSVNCLLHTPMHFLNRGTHECFNTLKLASSNLSMVLSPTTGITSQGFAYCLVAIRWMIPKIGSTDDTRHFGMRMGCMCLDSYSYLNFFHVNIATIIFIMFK